MNLLKENAEESECDRSEELFHADTGHPDV